MAELKAKILKIMKKYQVGVIATVTEDNKPWVRYVMVNVDEKDLGIWFATHLDSRKVTQIKKNPEVHLTLGVTTMEDMGNYFQVQGKAKIVTDAKIKKDRWIPGFKDYFKGADDPNYAIVQVKPYRIELVSMKGAEVWEA